MPTQDTSNLKEKILLTLKVKGPSLPVNIAAETNLSILFASAFLSELLSERKIKISNMRVGNSPIYFLPGQESSLEKFSQYLNRKEKEAFELLKNKQFLVDSKQDPAIRVALRALKDFAIPFKQNNEIIWRYFKAPETEFKKEEASKKEVQIKKTEKSLNILEKPKKTKSRTTRKPNTEKKNKRFFNKVKEFLDKKEIKILDILGFSKSDLILKVNENNEEKLLIAFNKKRIIDSDLLKAYKKASEYNLPYIVLSLGEPSKKLENFIKAIKDLSKIDKIN